MNELKMIASLICLLSSRGNFIRYDLFIKNLEKGISGGAEVLVKQTKCF